MELIVGAVLGTLLYFGVSNIIKKFFGKSKKLEKLKKYQINTKIYRDIVFKGHIQSCKIFFPTLSIPMPNDLECMISNTLTIDNNRIRFYCSSSKLKSNYDEWVKLLDGNLPKMDYIGKMIIDDYNINNIFPLNFKNNVYTFSYDIIN